MYIFLQTPFGQNWIVRQITKRLGRDLQTKISISHVDFSLFNRMHLEGVLLQDRQGDTLLYAGDMKLRITDWFFFKKEADLKYIGLDNALVRFQRTDSVWSQQFLFDYFSSPSAPRDSTKKKKTGIRFHLKKAELNNVVFEKKDGWLGQDMQVRIGNMNLDADKLSLAGNRFDINSLVVKDPVVALHSYPGRKPRDSTQRKEPDDTGESPASWHIGNTYFHIGNLLVVNGTFKTDKQSARAPLPGFDGQHILFTGIDLQLSNARLAGDSAVAQLKLAAKERCGLEVKNLSADAVFTPQGMFFQNMDLATNRSHLGNYFSMSYHDLGDMGDFLRKVRMAAVFDNAYVDSDDIAFFAQGLKSWKKKITITGKVRGTVDDLVARDMRIEAGLNTRLQGDISLTGLPDINQTFIDFKATDFRTTYQDAATIVPALRRVGSPDLRKISYLNFKGSFTGFTRDFVTYGTIQTNLGTIVSDINMKLPAGQQPIYSGTVSTSLFRLGEFLGDKKMGAVALKATVKGSGFSEKYRQVMVDGDIGFAEYNNYRYESIRVKGKLDKKLFEGTASMDDRNASFTLNGVIDLNGPTPRFDLLADVASIDFRNLNLTRDSLVFSGKLNFNFTSDNIDNFLGTARITGAQLTKEGQRLPFDSLALYSYIENGTKKLSLYTNEAEAHVEGDFVLAGLPDAFTYFLNKYYPAYVTAPKKFPANQDFRFSIKTFYADEYLQLLGAGLSGFNNSTFNGSISTIRNQLNFDADVQEFSLKNYYFNGAKIRATGTADSLVISGETSKLQINDSLSIPFAQFTVRASNDLSKVSLSTGASQKVEKADINAQVFTYNDGAKIKFDPSNFTINGKTWTIDENGELEFRSNTPARGMLSLRESDQRILFQTQPSAAGNWNNLKMELSNINLGDFAPYFMPRNRLEGLLSGTVTVEDPTGDLRIRSDDIQTRFLRLDNDSLGEIRTSLAYDNQSKQLRIKGNTLNMENYLGFDASIFTADKLKAKDNTIALQARNFQIKILERFLGTLFTDMQGYLTGDIHLDGEFRNLKITGKGRLKDAGLKVIFTQCFYRIKDTDVELTPTKIDLTGIVLTDTVTGNPIYLTGGIEHESFRNMFYNLDISTHKPRSRPGDNDNRPVLLLNTTIRDNKQFYGRVKGTGSLTLAGPQSEMFMTINAIASEKDSSYITLPPSSGRETGIADFLVERKYGREMTDSDFNRNATNIIYDVEVTANPLVTVKVVLDELTGDEIKGRGAGTLKIRSGTSEPLSLRGRFDIAEGEYLFTFQSFFKKPFLLKKGQDNFIEWSGDPYDARINLAAVYTASNVSYAPLVSAERSIDAGISRARGDVYVVVKLTEQLFKPKFNFSLEFPTSSVANNDPALGFSLQQLQKNENEMNKQATYLVVLGAFAPLESSGGVNFGAVATNSISGIFFNVLNEQLKKIISNIFKSDKWNVNFNSSIYNRNVISQGGFNLGSNVNASIGRSLFNNRVIVTASGTVEGLLGNNNTTVQQSVQILPDFLIEILINETGTFRANLFYKENIDYLTTNISSKTQKRTGVGLSYRKDFNHLGDLFRSRKKRQAANTPVANGDGTLQQ